MSDQLVRLSSPKKFLQDAMQEGVDLAVLIPEDSKPEFVLDKLRLSVSMGYQIKKWDGQSSLVIGRCLKLAHDDPKIWKAAGYKTFSDFQKAEVEDKGLSHGTACNGRKIIEIFEGLPIEKHINGGGVTNLTTAAYALPKDASEKQKKEALEKVKLPVAEYKSWIESRYGMEKGETDYGEVKFQGSRSQSDFVVAFLHSKAAQEYLETNHPMGMLVALIENSSPELGIEQIPDLDEDAPSGEPGPEDEESTGEPIPDDAAAEW